MPNNAVYHGWAAGKKLKYKMCSDGLKQPFPNFLFSRTAIFYLFLFHKLKQNYNLFIFTTISTNSDIILQEPTGLLYDSKFSKKTVLKKVSEQVSHCL